jgi:GNAT superfamily N-acetyltransferase
MKPSQPQPIAGFELDTDPDRVDVDALWRFLSEEAYWGRWRARADVERQLATSWRIVAAYECSSGRMVGFSRAISDGVATAYLADVYVERDARGRGLGSALVDEMIGRGPGADFRWMLHTADAHDLYGRFGFAKPDDSYLERRASGATSTYAEP